MKKQNHILTGHYNSGKIMVKLLAKTNVKIKCKLQNNLNKILILEISVYLMLGYQMKISR